MPEDQTQGTQPGTDSATPAATTPVDQGAPSDAPTGQQPDPNQNPVAYWQGQFEQMQNRFRGMQQLHGRAVTELQNAQAEIAQRDEVAQATERQLLETQNLAAQMTQDLQAAQQTAMRAQQEALYWNTVNQEYPHLAPIAGALQRMPTMDQQRALFDQVSQQMGTQVAAAATQQVTETLSGATPGAGPTAGTPAPGEYTRDEIMEHVMDENLMRTDIDEYNRWYERYQSHPDMGFASLGRGQWQDPFASDWQTMQRAAGTTPDLMQRHPTQAFEQNAMDQGFAGQSQQRAVGMPNAFGGVNPPTPPRTSG